MRYRLPVLVKEDVPTSDGRVLRQLVWRGEHLPLLEMDLNHSIAIDRPSDSIGTISELARTEDGVWSAVLDSNRENLAGRGIGVSVLEGVGSYDPVRELYTITGCRLYGAHVTDLPAWEDSVIGAST